MDGSVKDRAEGWEDGGRAVLAERVPVVLRNAARDGLVGADAARLAVKVDRTLLETVRRQTGIEDDETLIRFALAHVALDGAWLEDFKASRGTLDVALDTDF
ncbi:hypothetical protein [Salinarimonas ramus]|nr:hypothetical protein [Salinarimonas ramus]